MMYDDVYVCMLRGNVDDSIKQNEHFICEFVWLSFLQKVFVNVENVKLNSARSQCSVKHQVHEILEKV